MLPVEQQIRFCTAPDGVRLAYAVSGRGPPIVRVATWLTHLDLDRDSPVWRHWLDELADGHALVRYDERGCGLSDRHVGDLSVDAWVADLEAVVDAAGLDRFALLGISQAAAIAVVYAVRHPERVTHLVLYGGYARGRKLRGPEARREEDALLSVIRARWAEPDPTFRHLFSMLFLPEGTDEQMAWYDELQRRSTSAETAARLYDARGGIDVVEDAPRVAVSTLVAHARGDRVVPVDEGRLLGALIPGARLVLLESANHILLSDEPAWPAFLAELRAFLGTARADAGAPDRGPEPARARGDGAGRGGPDQRGDRPAPVPQRPHRGAARLERLRQAARLRQGGARRGRRELLAPPRAARGPSRVSPGRPRWV